MNNTRKHWRLWAYRPGKNSRITTRLYNVWVTMRRRCRDPKWWMYQWYGAKGIKVCDEWQSYARFRQWAIANGFRKGLSLDRIDNDRNYEPDNCRWATPAEQQRNVSSNIMLTLDGDTKPLPVWADEYGISPDLLRGRIYSGWSHKRAITTPRLSKSARRFYQSSGATE